jgi:hypothetical protein
MGIISLTQVGKGHVATIVIVLVVVIAALLVPVTTAAFVSTGFVDDDDHNNNSNDNGNKILPPFSSNIRPNDTETTDFIGYNVTKLDCSMRQLAWEYAEAILDHNQRHEMKKENEETKQPTTDDDYDDDHDLWRMTNDWTVLVKQQIHDALRLEALCGGGEGGIVALDRTPLTTRSTISTIVSSGEDNNSGSDGRAEKTRLASSAISSFTAQGRRQTRTASIKSGDAMNDNHHHQSPVTHEKLHQKRVRRLERLCQSSDNTHCIYIVPKSQSLHNANSKTQPQMTTTTKKNGSIEAPLDSLHDAMALARQIRQRPSGFTESTADFASSSTTSTRASTSTSTSTSTTTTRVHLILRQGIHTLRGVPLELTESDSNLRIVGYPGEQVWLSGGISLSSLVWKPWEHNQAIQVAQLPRSLFEQEGYSLGRVQKQSAQPPRPPPQQQKEASLTPLPKIVSLFTSTRRYIRARFPNADPEIDQWGYASTNRLNYSISPKDNVVEWHKPPPHGKQPNFTYFDFSSPDTVPLVPIKNNSAQSGYNWYASGQGGVCSTIWGDAADSYWCSNASQGGWSEVDRECAMTGRIQLPMGMTYNVSTDIGQRLDSWWSSNTATGSSTNTTSTVMGESSAVGGILHAWHSQSWSMHMFEIANHYGSTPTGSNENSTNTNNTKLATTSARTSPQSEFQFLPGGGRQGGRNWCRCDQCTYAGGWCGQHETPPKNNDTRLISGDFFIEQVLAELDRPGEYYFDAQSSKLYVYPNATTDLVDLRMALLDRLVTMTMGASNILVENIGFRDMAPTYMHDQWSAPSGGDWALHRGGAIFLENVQNVTIRNCHLFRLDGNAIFLSRRTRNVTIEQNRFEWLGESAIATWGDTASAEHRGYDGTAGQFPMYTTIQNNIFRELGIYQKQSSAVGQAKAALTTIRHNIMFNMPRAAINFNDMLGGGDVVEGNLIFNTCRESGDHGPINTWDRQAFLTTLRDGKTPSFDPLPRIIADNFIFANYGASQGIDNDDGSSWHHILRNVFYMADGFKMDYGGHDSVFEDNLVLSYPYDGSNCFNMGGFLPGHADVLRRNTCVIGLGNHQMGSGCGDPSCASPYPVDNVDSLEIVGMLWDGCDKGDSQVTLEGNHYYTPQGTAKIRCGDKEYNLKQVQEKYVLELGSTAGSIPADEQEMVDWARSMLFPSASRSSSEG